MQFTAATAFAIFSLAAALPQPDLFEQINTGCVNGRLNDGTFCGMNRHSKEWGGEFVGMDPTVRGKIAGRVTDIEDATSKKFRKRDLFEQINTGCVNGRLNDGTFCGMNRHSKEWGGEFVGMDPTVRGKIAGRVTDIEDATSKKF